MLDIVAALVSAVALGFFPIPIYKAVTKSSTLAVSLITLVFGASFFWLLLAILHFNNGIHLTVQEMLFFLIAGILAPGLVRPFYFIGVERIGPALATSLGSVSPFFILLPAILFLGERVTVPILVGIVLIVLGIFVLQKESILVDSESRHKNFISLGAISPLLSAIFFAGSVFFEKFGLNQVNLPLVAAALSTTAALIPNTVFVLSRHELRSLRIQTKSLIYILIASLAASAGWFFTVLSVSLGSAVVVTPILSTFPLFTLVFAAAVRQFKGNSRTLIYGTAVIALAIVIIEF